MNCEICFSSFAKSWITSEFYYCESCCYHRRKMQLPYNPDKTNWKGNHVKTYESGFEWRQNVANDRLALMSLIVERQSKIRLIDWGGASGILVKKAIDYGIDSWLYEPNVEFQDEARKRIPSEFIINDINKFECNFFDVLVAFDSLGYAVNLLEAIELINKLMRQDAVYIFSIGYIGAENRPHDLSFNYYFEEQFSKVVLPNLLRKKLFKYWIENRNFNTINNINRSQNWWIEYLNLNNNPLFQYLILK